MEIVDDFKPYGITGTHEWDWVDPVDSGTGRPMLRLDVGGAGVYLSEHDLRGLLDALKRVNRQMGMGE